MRMRYCGGCQKQTGYKRPLGFGTLFVVFHNGRALAVRDSPVSHSLHRVRASVRRALGYRHALVAAPIPAAGAARPLSVPRHRRGCLPPAPSGPNLLLRVNSLAKTPGCPRTAPTFPVGTNITLSATNGRSVIWSGVCSSGGIKTQTCTFTLNAAGSETANVQ